MPAIEENKVKVKEKKRSEDCQCGVVTHSYICVGSILNSFYDLQYALPGSSSIEPSGVNLPANS